MRRALWVAWVAAALVMGVGCEQPSSQKAKSAFLVRPEAIEFGPAALGRTKSFKLKIANGGRAAYRVEGAVSSVPNVEIPPFEPFVLSAGGEQEIEVHFTPQVEGVVQGMVEILTYSESDGLVPVNGRGVKAFVSRPRSLECSGGSMLIIMVRSLGSSAGGAS